MTSPAVRAFEPDAYMEKLLALREFDPARFNSLPSQVIKVLVEYEGERDLARREFLEKAVNCSDQR